MKFEDIFSYKLIYIFEIRDEIHKGLLKIGDTSIKTKFSIDNLAPNSQALNEAARNRINYYTSTAGIKFELLHTELAVKSIKDKNGEVKLKAFRDSAVHRVLINSGIRKKKIEGTKSREWFEVDIETAKKAIQAVKQNLNNLSGTNIKKFTPIVFRPEQQEAIERTIKQFKKGNEMLWNAKMRFGKTLSALQVVKQANFTKTIIITHRPVVDSGWYDDFTKIFQDPADYIYGSKSKGDTVKSLLQTGKNFVYFASIQDLRGSDYVGGKYNKNNDVFDTKWDLVIVDEAHEGTTTALGDSVIQRIVKKENKHTKFLALSGTPFNIIGKYDTNIYTWDYIMEQKSKSEWDISHFGDSNPYDELPEMCIYTYNLGKLIDVDYLELEDKAFNFREFFRTFTGNIKIDHCEMKKNQTIGDFVHEDDILSFLDLITKDSKDTDYPYSCEEYRDLFRHSLWIIPGVKEGKALSKLLQEHPVFGCGNFDIINVAGNGDKDEESDDALERVKKAIHSVGEDGYTITLSCGKLTTGVTVPEWTAVFMLAGSYSTSAANYLQTIFRVQSPCNKNGKIKKRAYVFDFAPDRTLKMVAESVAISSRAGQTSDGDRDALGQFLNYCPVISIDGTEMKPYDPNRLLQQLKRAYAERAVQSGFDDNSLYNDSLMTLNKVDIEEFKKLRGIVGSSKAQKKTNEIDINEQGFTKEEYERGEQGNKKHKKELSPEEKEALEQRKQKQKLKQTAISILRAISIRMPLMIYGANIPIDDDFTLDMFLDKNIVDSASWNEFMPTGVTKSTFKKFMRYYDPEVFIAAGRKIRNIANAADNLSPTERVYKITELFAYFKNPDKETVLTPWWVVNMHMSNCLGGYSFFDEKNPQLLLECPRFVDEGQVTADTFANPQAKILEINSKTGLYPLYVAYSIYRARLHGSNEKDLPLATLIQLWDTTIQNNIFVICKTPMAKTITKRTLVGYRDVTVNAHYFDDLINYMENKPDRFVQKITKANYWSKGGGKMKFDAVVGNPPYMIMDNGAQASAKPIYNHFVDAGKKQVRIICRLLFLLVGMPEAKD